MLRDHQLVESYHWLRDGLLPYQFSVKFELVDYGCSLEMYLTRRCAAMGAVSVYRNVTWLQLVNRGQHIHDDPYEGVYSVNKLMEVKGWTREDVIESFATRRPKV